MIHLYFKDIHLSLHSIDIINSINDWALQNFDLSFPTMLEPKPKWEWLRGYDQYGQNRIIGIALPDAEAVNIFLLKFPVEINFMFETIDEFHLYEKAA